MANSEKFFAVKGQVVQVGNLTKSGGRIVTLSTGDQLVKVIYNKDKQDKVPSFDEMTSVKVSTSELVFAE